MGRYTCEDRMARRYRNRQRFDILMFDRARARRFGVRKLRYRIVDTGDDEARNATGKLISEATNRATGPETEP